MSDCSDYPTAATAKTFKLDAGTVNEVVTLEQDRTSEASDGKTKKTFWGIENDATLQRENIEQLAEAQRDNLESTFASQFAYKRIGNISLYVGNSLPEVDKLNSYQYPDESGEWYGPVQDQAFPITIPADPSSDAEWALVNALTSDSLSAYTDIVYKASGGKSAVDVMLEANTDIGNIYNTGGTSWLKVSDSNGDIRDFEAVSSLHTSDFINNSTSTDDGDKFIDLLYVYFEIENSYQNSSAVDAWRFSGKNRHIHFNKKVTSTKPLPFIQACIYTSSKSINDFSRSIDTVDFMYTPSNLMSEAVKPLLYIKQPEGSYVLNTEPLKGTPDNEFNAGDSDYITGSSNVDFNIYVGTSPSVRLGLNSTGTTHSTGTFGIGVQEGGTDNVSAPQVGWYTSKAWASLYKKPYVFGRIQSLVTNDSIAGTQIQSPYLSRNGIADVDTDAVYTNSELSSSGKHKTSGLTALGGSDYHLSSPIIEHYKCPIVVSGYRSEVMITKPHIEAYDGAIDHSIIINGDAKIDVNNWEHLYATGGAEVIYTIGAVSGTRVYLRGGPMQLGPVNGLIGGDSSRPVLYVDHVSEAVSDYGAIGNVDLILGVQNPLLGRTIFVDADNGDDKQFGTRLANPIKTIEAAVKRVNLFFDKLDMTPYITLISDVSLLANSTLKTPVSIDIQSGNTLNSNGFYIELDTDISLNGNGGIAGSGSPFRSGQKICNIVVNGPTISTYSIVTSTNASQVNVSQISGNTSGISKYVDGGGQSPVVVSVNGGIRNTGIDSEPVATNHFILGSKFS